MMDRHDKAGCCLAAAFALNMLILVFGPVFFMPAMLCVCASFYLMSTDDPKDKK